MAFSGQRLKQALKIRNMKQSVLAYRLNVDKSYISNYISNRYSPRPEMVEKMAEILHVDAAWLSGFAAAEYIEPPELSEGEKELLNLFNSVPEEHREMALQVVQGALSALKKK